MKKFQNKYRIASTRLKHWDYRNNGAYFITICTANREPYFGAIINQTIALNAIGVLAEQFWMDIPNHFPFVTLGNFVIMPNHMHGILIIDRTHGNRVNNVGAGDTVETLHCNASTNPNTKNQQMAKISPKSGSISTIVRSYKSVVTKHARKIHADFGWQTRFHDHIIRNNTSFNNIQNYILENPLRWEKDKFYVHST